MFISKLKSQSLAGAPCYVNPTLASAACYVCVSMLFCSLGCQFAPTPSATVWPWKKVVAKAIPDRILPVWTDSVLHQPSQPGVRGFGGRVYFYGKENTEPVEVDGNFAVYVFDADDNTPSDQKPLRKYVFTADQFKTHMSKTSMGPSYSVWIPWGEVGGPPRRLSLISRFEGREGGTTISDPTIKMLPGVPVNHEIAKSHSESAKSLTLPISLASHTDATTPANKKHEASEKSNVEAIDLPPAFQRHLRAPSSATDSSRASQSHLPITQPANKSSVLLKHQEDGNLLKPQEDGNPSFRPGDASESRVPPIPTQVDDYRTRGIQRNSTSLSAKPTKTDIRKGHWIQPIARNNKRE